jgi:hypothetical protein
LRRLLILTLISSAATADIGFKEITYERVDGDEAAITTIDEGAGYLTIKGLATWVNQLGVEHTGELNNTVKVNNSTALYSFDRCKLTLKFEKKELIVSGDKGYCGGLGVGFNGHYEITTQEGIIYTNNSTDK